MLLSIYIAMMAVTFGFTILSFVPIGERRKSVRQSVGEEIKEESQSFVVIFPWIAMGLMFVLAYSSLDIVTVNCEIQVDSISDDDGAPATHFHNYTNSWSCYEDHQYSSELAWMFTGFGTIMLVYAIMATLLWSAGSLVVEVKKLTGE